MMVTKIEGGESMRFPIHFVRCDKCGVKEGFYADPGDEFPCKCGGVFKIKKNKIRIRERKTK